MKISEKLPYIVMAIGLLVLFSSVIAVLFTFLSIFNISIYFNISNNYIVGICAFAAVSFLQLFLSVFCKRISKVSARFTLDGLLAKHIAIDAELSSGNITEEEAAVKRFELQKNSDFFGAIAGCTVYFFKIGKITALWFMCTIIILLTIGWLKIITIDNKYIMSIIVYGILSQIILILTSIYVTSIVYRNYRNV